jgi:hypothetical protein
MKKRWMVTLAILIALGIPSVTHGHEGHMHKALGTIASIQGERVEIKTTAGKMVTVVLGTKTTVTRGKEKLDTTALKVGERISVDYMEEKKVMMAHAIKLSTAAGKTVKK